MPLTKKESQTFPSSKSILKSFLLASRPRTWIASISPVLIGASFVEEKSYFLLTLTLLFALSIQIGTNFANDYFDFFKGADTEERIGPPRALQMGLLSPKMLMNGIFFTFALSLVFAAPLMMQAGLWSFFLALLCIALGILYTGGPKPLAYLGLGEVFVIIFFGVVPCLGTYFLQTGELSSSVLLASLAPGALSSALLTANNLRDFQTDRKAHKRTLIVRFGKLFGALEYTLWILMSASISFLFPQKLLSIIPLLFLLPSIYKTFSFSDPKEMIPLLKRTAFAQIGFTLLFLL